MKRILITGASGNVGYEVIRFLSEIGSTNKIIAGVRNIENAKKMFVNQPTPEFVYFDFEKAESFENALKDIDTIFLLRPPHITDIEKYFRPLTKKIAELKIAEIVFLSVQGAEKSKIIPHNKIENLIQEYKIDYIFLRPSYFMQNLTTTLFENINKNRQIILPAGNAKFNWIDIENIAEVSAILLNNFSDYKNRTIELTGDENINFSSVARLINSSIIKPIAFVNVNPFKFYSIKNKEGMVKPMILVMIMLHFLPRFQKKPFISDHYEKISGKKPTKLIEFIEREKIKFEQAPI